MVDQNLEGLRESSPDFIDGEDFGQRLDYYRAAYETLEVGFCFIFFFLRPVTVVRDTRHCCSLFCLSLGGFLRITGLAVKFDSF